MCGQKLKDRHLLAWIGGLVALDVLFLAIWSGVGPLHRALVPLPLQVSDCLPPTGQGSAPCTASWCPSRCRSVTLMSLPPAAGQ